MKSGFDKYREKFSLAREYNIPHGHAKSACAVVVPACRESKYLPATLRSLSANDRNLLARTCVIVVVNRPRGRDDDAETIRDNMETIRWLRNDAPSGLDTLLVSGKDGNSDLVLDGGVGKARKIGMDIALEMLSGEPSSFIASLDADTTVEPDYLSSLFGFFASGKADAAVLGYSHRRDACPAAAEAMETYERYLENYVEGLRRAGSPYAFHTVGSAMAFTAEAYVRAGGMKIRKGGEDFYFLQALRKTASIAGIKKILVHPSGRLSDRVPFGTGPALKKIMAGEKIISHNPMVFTSLGKLLSSSKNLCENRNPDITVWLECLEEEAMEFLLRNNFPEQWPKIARNCPDSAGKRIEAFHRWFDAFRTLKFIHFCENRAK